MEKEMTEPDFDALLRRNNLKRTDTRIRVLTMMASKTSATSPPELEAAMGDIDRVTLYRILHTFEEKGIVHKVFNTRGTANYALCSSEWKGSSVTRDHPHFNCTRCKNVFCIDFAREPKVIIPDGFMLEAITVSATGLCPECSSK